MLIHLKLPLIKCAINGIIAPHGITDIIHAQQNYLIPQLFSINGLTILSSVLLHKYHLKNVLNVLFISSSIIHFRRDFPKNKFIPRILFSSILLLISIFYNHNILLFYMLVIHVPNHYNLNWKYLKNEKIQTISTLSISTALFLIIGNNFDFLTLTPLIKGLIISHVIYGEIFIFNFNFNFAKTEFIKYVTLENIRIP
jgi:hypothetical protein